MLNLLYSLEQICPTEIAYWAKIYVTIFNQGRTLNDLVNYNGNDYMEI